jgi:rhamnosyltransferase
MTGPVLASVIVRAKNEGRNIGRTLSLLDAQTVRDRLEVIVVDSGSRDDTVAIARSAGAHIIEIPPESFTFGRALNIGCRAASAEVIIALSAHAYPVGRTWAERTVKTFADERVACVSARPTGPAGELLTAPRVADKEELRANPFWGYSNVSGAFRARLWRERGFREDMPGTEDKEWSFYWAERGFVTVIDPTLEVEHSHDDDTLRQIARRARREWEGFAMYLALPRYGARELVREWWTKSDGCRSQLQARLSPQRLAHVIGKYQGLRATR